MHQQKQQQQHLDNPAYGQDPDTGTVMTDYGPAPAYQTDKPPRYDSECNEFLGGLAHL